MEGGVVEKAIILVVDKALGEPRVTKGTYQNLDALAKRASAGFVSTFKNCKDTITQLTGINYHGVEKFIEEVGPMKLAVLKATSTFDQYGDIISIENMDTQQIYSEICAVILNHSVVVVEIASLSIADQIVKSLMPKIDAENIAIAVLAGYKDGAKIPHFTSPPPVITPSWKIIGPNTVEDLDASHPMCFVTASKQLTRIDYVQAYDEDDIEAHNCMSILPICQYFREFSYYTGSSWKYGA